MRKLNLGAWGYLLSVKEGVVFRVVIDKEKFAVAGDYVAVSMPYKVIIGYRIIVEAAVASEPENGRINPNTLIVAFADKSRNNCRGLRTPIVKTRGIVIVITCKNGIAKIGRSTKRLPYRSISGLRELLLRRLKRSFGSTEDWLQF